MASESAGSAAAELPRRRSDELLSLLAERVGARFAAATVFGAPVQQGGVTVIPVACARFAIGGGGGGDSTKGQDGEGGGGGGSVAPAGYIELKDDRSRFVPAVHPARMVALVGAALLAALLIVRPQPTAPRARLLRRR